jgi:hypothetical protein
MVHIALVPAPVIEPVRHTLRRWIAARPEVYLPLARWKNEHSVLDRHTNIVIDGFTRSAGTFAAIAFQVAQNDHVRVAHHMHAAAPLLAAASRGLPVLLPVREPNATVLSACVREPHVTLRQWLKTYVDFYERLAPMRAAFVIATFDEVTSDFGGVIRRVNERFGTAFREFDHTQTAVREIFALIDERAEGPPWQPHFNRFVSGLLSIDQYRAATAAYRGPGATRPSAPQLRVPHPTPARQKAKAAVRRRYLDPSLADARRSAELAYRALVDGRTVR